MTFEFERHRAERDPQEARATCLREEADNYSRVLVTLNPRWRVILCDHSIQWILQKRTSQRHGTRRWEAKGYFRRRDRLIRVCRASAGQVEAAALAVLEGLPPILL